MCGGVWRTTSTSWHSVPQGAGRIHCCAFSLGGRCGQEQNVPDVSCKLHHKNTIRLHTVHQCTKEMARWLNLDHSNQYTSHSLRRSAATTAADSGSTEVSMMRHFGWRSAQMANHSVRESALGRAEMAGAIMHEPGSAPEETPPQEPPVLSTGVGHFEWCQRVQ